jgi:two-component system, chemotaxis family, CheB/CheR fusion protein
MVKENQIFPIVCIGGSAGGFPAYEQILLNLAFDTGMTFIIVAHRSDAGGDSLLYLLKRRTGMDVVDAEEGTPLIPNQLILSAPHRAITTDGDCIHLAPYAALDGWPVLISGFLQSMVLTCASRSIAVIVSGMGYDGSNALGAIKQNGGVTFAQSGAEYDSMPNAAMATGHIDWMLDADEIGKKLTTIAKQKIL